MEKKVRELLDGMAVEYIQEAKAGRYSIDFLIPPNLAIEVDGAYWHQDKKRDKRKNKWLHKHGYIILRLPEHTVENELWACEQLILHFLPELSRAESNTGKIHDGEGHHHRHQEIHY